MNISAMERVSLEPSCVEGDSNIYISNLFITREVQRQSDIWIKKNGNVETGEAAWTTPGKMDNCKVIIHAVGPVWSYVSFFLFILNHFRVAETT